MSCIVVLKEKLCHSAKHFLWGGGGTVGKVIKKNVMSLWGQEENVSSKEIPRSPSRDFKNERSLNKPESKLS